MSRLVHSYWSPDPPPQSEAALEGKRHFDVVVIGGGINGVSAAYHLRRAGADVALLERGAVGGGASSRNFGVLTSQWAYHGHSPAGQAVLARHGERALEAVRAMVEREGIACDLKRRRHWLLAGSEADARQARDEAETLRGLGYEAGFVEAAAVDVTTAPTAGALTLMQYVVDPARLLAGYKAAALRAGVRIFEGSPVARIVDGAPAVVRTASGSASARSVVVAANGFTGGFGLDTLRYAMPLRIHALATRPLPPDLVARIGVPHDEAATDRGSRVDGARRHWQRLRPDGVLLFGGGGYHLPDPRDIAEPTVSPRTRAALVRELVRRYPALTEADVAMFWGGIITAPAGERPTVARLPGTEALVLVQCCYGHGMGLGARIGELVAGIVVPETMTDPDARAFLHYCRIGDGARRWAEGAAFRAMVRTPLRHLANRLNEQS